MMAFAAMTAGMAVLWICLAAMERIRNRLLDRLERLQMRLEEAESKTRRNDSTFQGEILRERQRADRLTADILRDISAVERVFSAELAAIRNKLLQNGGPCLKAATEPPQKPAEPVPTQSVCDECECHPCECVPYCDACNNPEDECECGELDDDDDEQDPEEDDCDECGLPESECECCTRCGTYPCECDEDDLDEVDDEDDDGEAEAMGGDAEEK